MALPSNLYIPFQGLQTYFVDKITGDPLSAGYVEFFSDVARTVPKDVFQQVQLPDNTYNFVNIGSIITLSSVGTFQSPNDGTDIQVYAYPYDADGEIELYFMEVFSSGATLQFTREAQPPNVLASSGTDSFEGSDNIISNSQFVESFLPESLTNTFSVTGSNLETFIAPDWSLITTGSGSVTVTIEELSNTTMPTGAPYALKISSTGLTTSLTLRQRILQSPRLLGQGFICGSLVAKNFLAGTVQLIMRYVASNGYTVDLVSQSAGSDYATLSDTPPSKAIATTNTNTPDTPGYIDITIIIPALSSVGITSVQVVSTESADSSTPFLQESTPRQIDHLFHYYKPQLIYKPIPSWLVGWDFPLNPAQLFGDTVPRSAIGTNKSKYVWDQTIMFESVNNSTDVARGVGGGLEMTAVISSRNALVQYLPQETARKILHSPISVNVSAYTSIAAGIVSTVSLWYTTDAALPDINPGTNNSIVATIDANGKPATRNGTWTEVPRLGHLGNAKFTIAVKSTEEFHDYSFNNWDVEGIAGANTATFFAIVVGLGAIPLGETVTFNSISLCSGDIATRPAPQTQDQVLRECEYYYEKSKASQDLLTTAAASDSTAYSALIRQQFIPAAGTALFTRSFGIEYKVPKYGVPVNNVYSEAGTLNNVSGYINYAGSGIQAGPTNIAASGAFFTKVDAGVKGIQYRATSAAASGVSFAGPAISVTEAYISFHYEADARLGII